MSLPRDGEKIMRRAFCVAVALVVVAILFGPLVKLLSLEAKDQPKSEKANAGSPWAVAHPGFPRIRTCALERIRLVRAWVRYQR